MIFFCPLAFSGSMMTMPSARLRTARSVAALAHGASSQWLHITGRKRASRIG